MDNKIYFNIVLILTILLISPLAYAQQAANTGTAQVQTKPDYKMDQLAQVKPVEEKVVTAPDYKIDQKVNVKTSETKIVATPKIEPGTVKVESTPSYKVVKTPQYQPTKVKNETNSVTSYTNTTPKIKLDEAKVKTKPVTSYTNTTPKIKPYEVKIEDKTPNAITNTTPKIKPYEVKIEDKTPNAITSTIPMIKPYEIKIEDKISNSYTDITTQVKPGEVRIENFPQAEIVSLNHFRAEIIFEGVSLDTTNFAEADFTGLSIHIRNQHHSVGKGICAAQIEESQINCIIDFSAAAGEKFERIAVKPLGLIDAGFTSVIATVYDDSGKTIAVSDLIEANLTLINTNQYAVPLGIELNPVVE